MRLGNRLRILEAYRHADAETRPGPIDLLRNGLLKLPSERLAPRYISRIDEDGGYLRVWLAGVEAPLYWPADLPRFDLNRVVTECCYPADWHYYETAETTVRPNDTVLDCGAAEGLFALRVAGRAGRVFAFEPQPVFVEAMRRTFAALPHVQVEPSALGRSASTMRLAGQSLTGRLDDGGTGTAVPVVRLDDWARDAGIARIDYLKADVEGFEIDLLEGARGLIARDAPRIAITVYHRANDWRAIRDLLASLTPRYRFRIKGLYGFDGPPARPVMLHAWT
jgi:FkbM family methyltransferase